MKYLKNRLKYLFSLSLVKDSIKLSSSNVLLFFIPLIVTPILSRIYTPYDYGELGIFTSIYIIINYIIFLSYDNAIIQTNSRSEIPNLIILCIIIAFVIISLISFTFYVGNKLQLDFFSIYPRYDLLIIFLIFSTILNLATAIANRFELFTAMSISNISNGLFQATLRVAFGVIIIFKNGLILGTVIANMFAAIILLLLIIPILKKISWDKISFLKIIELLKRYKKFPLYDAPSNLLNFSVGQLTIIILTFYYSTQDIGCFSMITQFVLLPVSFIGSAISKVYYRKISSLGDNINELRIITLQVSKIIALMCLLPALFLILGGDKMIIWFLGDRWASAGNIALCLSIISIPIILTEALLPIYRSLNLQNIRFKYDLYCFILSLGALLIFCNLTHNILFPIIIYSLIFGLIRFVMFFNILKTLNLIINDISKLLLPGIVLCYIGVFVRLCLKFYN